MANVFDFLMYWKLRGDGTSNAQVRIMKQIYTYAELAIVSLGAHNSLVEDAIAILPVLVAEISDEQDIVLNEESALAHGLPPEDSLSWKGLFELFLSTWF
ncbi:hypothetical protein MMC18_005232 [Xylographa bjoerkii]|nr:hypothetical protein [Xylographa bjoerkii]